MERSQSEEAAENRAIVDLAAEANWLNHLPNIDHAGENKIPSRSINYEIE
jgi:hypothetical protein